MDPSPPPPRRRDAAIMTESELAAQTAEHLEMMRAHERERQANGQQSWTHLYEPQPSDPGDETLFPSPPFSEEYSTAVEAAAAEMRARREAEEQERMRDLAAQYRFNDYKGMMKRAYQHFIELINGTKDDGWTPVEHDRGRDYLLQELDTEGSAYYVLRASRNIQAQAARVATIMSDTDFDRKMRWDADSLSRISVVTPEGEEASLPGLRLLHRMYNPPRDGSTEIPVHKMFEVVESYVSAPKVLGLKMPVATRRFLVLQWRFYNPRSREWVIISKTIVHPHFPPPEGVIDVEGFAGCRILESDSDPGRCHLTMIANVDPKGWIPKEVIKWGRTQLLGLTDKVERGCADPLFTEVYGVQGRTGGF